MLTPLLKKVPWYAWLCVAVIVTFVQRYTWERTWENYYEILPVACAIIVLLGRSRFPFLVVIPLLVMQHIHYGGVWFFPQMLMSGRSSWLPCISAANFDAMVNVSVITSGNKERVVSMHEQAKHYNMRVNFYRDRPVNASLSQYELYCLAYRGLILANRDSEKPWQLILEDDAALHTGFKHQLSCILDTPVEMIWLDARTHIDYIVNRAFALGTAGILYRTAISDRFASAICDGPVHDEFFARTGFKRKNHDLLMADLCTRGYFKCYARPLVSEAGFGSVSSV